MLPILLLALMVYVNARLARKKGLNPIAWGAVTFAAFFLAYLLLGSFYVMMIYKGPLTREALQSWLMASPLTQVMLAMLGVGGFLLVRYVLERKKSV